MWSNSRTLLWLFSPHNQNNPPEKQKGTADKVITVTSFSKATQKQSLTAVKRITFFLKCMGVDYRFLCILVCTNRSGKAISDDPIIMLISAMHILQVLQGSRHNRQLRKDKCSRRNNYKWSYKLQIQLGALSSWSVVQQQCGLLMTTPAPSSTGTLSCWH